MGGRLRVAGAVAVGFLAVTAALTIAAHSDDKSSNGSATTSTTLGAAVTTSTAVASSSTFVTVPPTSSASTTIPVVEGEWMADVFMPLEGSAWCDRVQELAGQMGAEDVKVLAGTVPADAIWVALSWSRAYAIAGVAIGPEDLPDAMTFAVFHDAPDGDWTFDEVSWDGVRGAEAFGESVQDPAIVAFRATVTVGDGAIAVDCTKPMGT